MKNKIFFILKVIISVALLTYLLTKIPISEILSAIKSAELILVLAGVALIAPISLLSALKTKYITEIQGMNLSVFEILKIQLATNFYGLFLPGGSLSQGAVKWYKLSKHSNKSSAAAVVVFNRFLEVMIIILAGIFLSIPEVSSSGQIKLLPFFLIVLLLIGVIFYFLLHKSGYLLIKKISSVFPLPDFIEQKTTRFADAMYLFNNFHPVDLIKIIGIIIFYNGLGVLSFFCFAESLNINLTIWVIGWIRSAMILAIMLPFSIAGLGIREGTLVILLGQYGVLPNVAMALSFLFLFRNLLPAFVGGFFELKQFTFSKKNRINSGKTN